MPRPIVAMIMLLSLTVAAGCASRHADPARPSAHAADPAAPGSAGNERPLTHLDRALAILEGHLGGTDPALVPLLDCRMRLSASAAQWSSASADGERILAILAQHGGTDRQEYVAVLNGVVALHVQSGDLIRAIARAREAAAILARVLGPADPNLGVAQQNLAGLLRRTGREADRIEADRILSGEGTVPPMLAPVAAAPLR